MTRSIAEARFEIERRLIDLAAGADRAPLVESIQAEQDGNAILVFSHLCDGELNGGCPLCASVEWGATAFDAAEFVRAFWAAGPPSTARN